MSTLTATNSQEIQKPQVVVRGGGSDSVYGLGFIGALVYYLGRARNPQDRRHPQFCQLEHPPPCWQDHRNLQGVKGRLTARPGQSQHGGGERYGHPVNIKAQPVPQPATAPAQPAEPAKRDSNPDFKDLIKGILN